MQPTNIVSLFVEDHERIALLLKDFNKSQNKKSKKAAAAFQQLSKDLIRHFHQEEILYSKYRYNTGTVIPVIQTVRKEHEIILKRIEKIKNSLNKGSTNIDATRLSSLFERHKNIENILLYPELDRVLSDTEKEEVYWKIRVR